MSELACNISPLPVASYPPLKTTLGDAILLAKIRLLQAEAPFGRSPKQAQPITATQYKDAMRKQIAAAESIDFRWPFFVGLGLGGVGFLIALSKR